MSSAADPASGAKYRVLRELGARHCATWAAVREPRELVVLHRFARAGRTRGAGVVELASAEALDTLVASADTIARNWHPNVARVRHVDVYGDQIAIATELLDGATLEDLARIAAARSNASLTDELPLPVFVRVLLDILAGLHALHALRGPDNGRLRLVHGALGPANVVVGRDGVARIVNVLRPPAPRPHPAAEAIGYAAPELLEGDPLDPRGDVYSAGVLLWEALSGRRLWDETDPERLRARQRAEEIPTPRAPSTPGLEHLPAIALRALSFDPTRRFKSAADMASELRRPRDAQIASGANVAAAVAALDGERVRGRRARLDPSGSGARLRPTDEQIAEHLAALEPVEPPPETVAYAEQPARPASTPTVPPGLGGDDDAGWDSPGGTLAPPAAAAPAPSAPVLGPEAAPSIPLVAAAPAPAAPPPAAQAAPPPAAKPAPPAPKSAPAAKPAPPAPPAPKSVHATKAAPPAPKSAPAAKPAPPAPKSAPAIQAAPPAPKSAPATKAAPPAPKSAPATKAAPPAPKSAPLAGGGSDANHADPTSTPSFASAGPPPTAPAATPASSLAVAPSAVAPAPPPMRPRAISIALPESEAQIPTAAYAPAFPSMSGMPIAGPPPQRPSSTTSVVAEVDDTLPPGPAPRRRRPALLLAAAVGVIALGMLFVGVRMALAPPPPPLTFTAPPPEQTSPAATSTAAVAPTPPVVTSALVAVPAPPPSATTAPVPTARASGDASSPPPGPRGGAPAVTAKPKRYEPLGI